MHEDHRAARWGVVADDVTGACDVGAELRELGLAVALVLGVPSAADVPTDADVVVVGLRTRTAEREVAVRETVETARALRAAGITRWYQKYCSTFDSTDDGMIGPVAEALMAEASASTSIGTPATPHADRTVYRGHLFVGDRLLSESPLARHPLTPMTDPDIVRVLSRQSVLPVRLAPLGSVRSGFLDAAIAAGGHVLADALDDADLDEIAAVAARYDVLTGGGAGLMTAIGRMLAAGRSPAASPPGGEVVGADLVIVGSASERTREQLDHVGGPSVAVDAVRAARHPAAAAASAIAAAQAELAAGRVPVVSASHDASAIAAAQRSLGTATAAAAVEDVLGAVASTAVARLGVRRIIVAGGETSGSVTRALGIRALRLTRRVDPGVAWSVGAATALPERPEVAVLLKSGNFGGADLFTRAWGEAP